jgi:formylmethanofuran dehydrogenase subunit B
MTPGIKVSSLSPVSTSTSSRTADVAWTCPYCALHCDSLAVVAEAASLTLSGTQCTKAHAALRFCDFELARSARCSIDGSASTLEASVAQAAQWLGSASQPLFAGLITDVAGMRALYPLADACSAILDHAHGDAVMASVLPTQDRGAFGTTLAEVRNRADLIVCMGTQPSTKTPELFRRIGVASDTPAMIERNVVFIGTATDPALQDAPGVHASAIDADLHDAVSVLNALVSGRKLTDAAPELAALAQAMRNAKYTVLVWSPSELPDAHPALLVEAMHRLVKSLNKTTRAGALVLSGHDGAATANYVATWLSGLPLRTRSGTPLQHEPHLHGTAQLLADTAVDVVLWLADLAPAALLDLAPPEHDLPMIVIGHHGLAAALAKRSAPTVFIPVATPGISSAGHVFRLDGGIALPLRAVCDDGLPSASAVLRALLAAMPARGLA